MHIKHFQLSRVVPLAFLAFVAASLISPLRCAAEESAEAMRTVEEAEVVLPADSVNGTPAHIKGRDLAQVPGNTGHALPVVIFLHGSGGLSPAIREFQDWLAGIGIASIAPNSFVRSNRPTYQSPAPKEVYEAVHKLRAEELDMAIKFVSSNRRFNARKIFLAGSSEGAVAIARSMQRDAAGRLILSWSCEDNYFVQGHRTVASKGEPVLNIMSLSDPYFSSASPLNSGTPVKGHCGDAFAANTAAAIVLLPGAPHTLFNLPLARSAIQEFLRR